MYENLLILIDNLRTKLIRWRIVAFLTFGILIVLLAYQNSNQILKNKTFNKPFIAKIEIHGPMMKQDKEKLADLQRIADDKNIVALLISVNSPGGLVTAAEDVFQAIKKIEKPVVISMRDMATSAAYYISTAANQIFAYNGTMTGSIGVIMQYYEFAELAKKIGVKDRRFRSSEVKGGPSIIEEPSKAMIKEYTDLAVIIHQNFKKIVKENRNLTDAALAKVATGEVFAAKQALDLKLIDQIGTECDAIKWMRSEYKIDDNVRMMDLMPKEDKMNILKRLPQKIHKILDHIEQYFAQKEISITMQR